MVGACQAWETLNRRVAVLLGSGEVPRGWCAGGGSRGLRISSVFRGIFCDFCEISPRPVLNQPDHQMQPTNTADHLLVKLQRCSLHCYVLDTGEDIAFCAVVYLWENVGT